MIKQIEKFSQVEEGNLREVPLECYPKGQTKILNITDVQTKKKHENETYRREQIESFLRWEKEVIASLFHPSPQRNTTE